jgi:hypothetical protein
VLDGGGDNHVHHVNPSRSDVRAGRGGRELKSLR